jgi:pimeloyl-ACP methyl ester carboxylesterase
MRRIAFSLPMLTFMLCLSGCSCRLNVPVSGAKIQTRTSMMLNGHPFELRLSKPSSVSPENALVVYATGDGGWYGLGTDMFNWLASWNYSVAGFSSRSYLHILGHLSEAGTTTPELLARDYDSIIAFAEQRLGLPASTPVILVGVSRGAGLSVVAAGAGIMHRPVAGLLAVALIKEEEHVLHSQRRGNKSDSESRLSQVAVDTYLYLNRLDPFPLMVLQSTHDGYLSAGDARNLFGPDSEMRKLRAIEATNHSFHNGCQTLNQEAENALRWIVSLLRK